MLKHPAIRKMVNLPEVEHREIAKPKEESFWENLKAGKCLCYYSMFLDRRFQEGTAYRPFSVYFFF